jgi:hypothetical protein
MSTKTGQGVRVTLLKARPANLLPIRFTEFERAQINRRLSNRLRVIFNAAHAIMIGPNEDETPARAETIQDAARGISEDIDKVLGRGIRKKTVWPGGG